MIVHILPPFAFACVFTVCKWHQPHLTTFQQCAHNLTLCVFSAFMCGYMCFHWIAFGLPKNVCAQRPMMPTWFHILWYASKFWEWIDTIILMSRRRSILRLHAVHHAITPSLVSLQVSRNGLHAPLYEWGTMLNAAVHTVMYLYFAFPQRFNAKARRTITVLQTLQHIFMFQFILRSIYVMTVRAEPCVVDRTENWFPFVAYTFFFYEFAKLACGVPQKKNSKHEL